jgi:exonuclease III
MVCGINAACWNINGLYEIVRNERICKLDYTDVLTEINKHDIYCMQETHIGPEEKINVPHYFVHSITRPKNNRAIRHSGGLLLFIKESLKSKITIIPNSTSEHCWLKLPKKEFNCHKDIYICFVYARPSYTLESNQNYLDLWETLLSEISNFSEAGTCIMMGDLNGHTAESPDYVTLDQYGNDYIQVEPGYIEDTHLLARSNKDKHNINDNGRMLLDMYISSGLCIANGRVIGDLEGHFTRHPHRGKNDCPGVLDYALFHFSLSNYISHFKVCDISVHSDHCYFFKCYVIFYT